MVATTAWPKYDTARYPAGPKTPKMVQLARLTYDPLGYMLAARARFGPVFTLRFYPYEAVVCATDPTTIKQVLTDQDSFVAGEAANLLIPLVGAGSLIVTPPPRHLRNRKLLLPPFHGERVAQWGDRMRELVVAELDRLPVDRPVAIRPVGQRLTLDVILRLVFGLRDATRVAEFRAAIDPMMARTMAILLFADPLRRDVGRWSPGGVFARRRDRVVSLIRNEIRDRRRALDREERDDVLSLLLHVQDEDGRGLSDGELVDELMGLVIAGHETTATGLAWTLHMLAHNPGPRDALTAALAAGDGQELLKATVKESLRIRPPVLDAVRIATRDTELAGRPIPAGAFVAAMFCVAHLAPDVWPKPDEFRPERHVGDRAVPYAWAPFGGGVRRCLGAALAQLELEVAVREVLARSMLEPAGAVEAVRLNGVTLIPARGGRVVLRPRR
jgi:cytochrome P450